jgi:putative ABC transport system ATP-binding protein
VFSSSPAAHAHPGDNIALPCLLGAAGGEERAARLAARVGIGHRLRHYPQEVSGGEMQRAAIARALVHEPALLVADEPTGNLDSASGARVLALLGELNRELGITVLLATHAQEVAAAAGRVMRMRDGRFADAVPVPGSRFPVPGTVDALPTV